MLNPLKIRAAGKYLTRKACAKLTISLVTFHLDYTNAVLAGLPKVSVDTLQREQNMAAKTIKQRSIGQFNQMPRRITLAPNRTKDKL